MSLANAIIDNHPDLVAQYLQMGVPLNELDEYGYTPLIEAAIANNTRLVEWLLNQGAHADGEDLVGGSALHWAVENNNQKMSALLLSHGANPNAYTTASESCLVKPLLRRQKPLKDLLVQHGGSIQFAQDFIHTKLLGHRFDLVGAVDIVDYRGQFTEVDLEGFFLEFSLDVIYYSLRDFCRNFAAKNLAQKFYAIRHVLNALAIASELIRYQHYQIDIEQYISHIQSLLSMDELLIIPVGYQGHAITLVKYKNKLTLCNRRRVNAFADHLIIQEIGNPRAFNFELIRHCLYEKSSLEFIESELPSLLQLRPLTRLMIKRQIAGNCSWANVEVSIAVALYYLLQNFSQTISPIIPRQHEGINIYRQWKEWDKDRALSFCLNDFHQASSARKASKASLLAAVLFQRCSLNYKKDRKRARVISRLLRNQDYGYILDNYISIYQHYQSTPAGKNLQKIIEFYEDPWV